MDEAAIEAAAATPLAPLFERIGLLQTDVHAPTKFRVNGPLANLPAFATAYKCKPGTGFLRKTTERVAVW